MSGRVTFRVSAALYPFTGRFFDRGGGIQMHYLDEGPTASAAEASDSGSAHSTSSSDAGTGPNPSPPTVVMVHGNPTWSFMWRELVQALRPHFRVIAPDHVGMGFSDKPGDDAYDYHIATRVNDLDALLTHAEVGDNVTLIVHDWGGLIGLAWALRHPEKIQRIVLFNTGAFPNPKGLRIPWSLRIVRDTPIGAILVRGFNAFAAGATRMAAMKPLAPDVAAAFVAPYDSWEHRIATLRFVQAIPLTEKDVGYDLVRATGEGLSAFAKVPVAIFWGGRDFVFDDSFLARWREIWPHAQVTRYPEAGHYVLEDETADIVPKVRSFLGLPDAG